MALGLVQMGYSLDKTLKYRDQIHRQSGFSEAGISESRAVCRLQTCHPHCLLFLLLMHRCPQGIVTHLLLIIFWFNCRQVNRYTMKMFMVRDFLVHWMFGGFSLSFWLFRRFEMQLHCGKGGGWLLFFQECNANQRSFSWKGKRTVEL